MLLFLLFSWLCSIKPHRLPSSIFRPSPNYSKIGLYKNWSTLVDKCFSQANEDRCGWLHDNTQHRSIGYGKWRRFTNFLLVSTQPQAIQFELLLLWKSSRSPHSSTNVSKQVDIFWICRRGLSGWLENLKQTRKMFWESIRRSVSRAHSPPKNLFQDPSWEDLLEKQWNLLPVWGNLNDLQWPKNSSLVRVRIVRWAVKLIRDLEAILLLTMGLFQ